MTNCSNCNNLIIENYCPKCGQIAKLKRIDIHYLQHEILHLFHLEKGFIFTIRKLLTNPGQSIRAYIGDNRNKLMKPVPFLIFCSLLYSFVGYFFNPKKVNDSFAKIEIENSHITIFLDWLQDHYGYANLAVGVFIAFFLKLFFKKHQYNFFEIITMLCFLLAINMISMSILVIFYSGLNIVVYGTLFSAMVYGFPIWAIADFFDRTKILSYLKAALAFVLGYFLYFVTVALAGIATDYAVKFFE